MDDWISYLEADPKSEPFLSIAAAWKADKARLAEAEALLRTAIANCDLTGYEGAASWADRRAAFLAADSAPTAQRGSLAGGCRCGSDGSPYAPCVCGGRKATDQP